MNSSYLSRVYKKETNATVTDAINKYRIKKAKEILGKRRIKCTKWEDWWELKIRHILPMYF